MLVKGVIAIGTKIRITIPTQRLCASIITYSTSSNSSSGSSSDSSSDSDSDTEHLQKIKKYQQHDTIGNSSTETSTFKILIDKMTQENNDTGTMDVAIPLRKTVTKEKLHPKPNLSYERQLTEAVENVTNVLTGDKKEIKLQLLDKLSHMHKDNTKTKKKDNLGNLNELVTQMKVETQSKFTETNRNIYNKESWKSKTGIIHELKAQQERKENKYATDNTKNINNNITRTQYQYHAEQRNVFAIKQQRTESIELSLKNFTIFQNMEEHTTIVPELSVWKSLEQRELALISTQTPQNIFQEMIQWTESGKLWIFPIDNEYGMEEEHNVHFSEHVFLERHLKDWCPKRGPIRHFMELVCIGLSKNPYMTVDEKIEHITWYKEYFKGKEEILKELGAIDVSSNMKEQIKS